MDEQEMQVYQAGAAKDIKLFDTLFSLYTDVLNTLEDWKQYLWTDVTLNMEEMTDKMD